MNKYIKKYMTKYETPHERGYFETPLDPTVDLTNTAVVSCNGLGVHIALILSQVRLVIPTATYYLKILHY